jgi:hypothetical protein
MRAWLAVTMAAAIAAGCAGPPAPDAEVCNDLIHRVCLPQICPAAAAALAVTSTCELALQDRTRCDDPEFVFPESLGRQRVLDCRRPLLREGLARDQHPSCQDVQDLLDFCPDVVAWLNGAVP